jgi:hypothetical protein
MKRATTVVMTLGLVGLLAAPAVANFDANATLTCWVAAEGRLLRGRLGNDDIVAACLGVDEGDPLIASYALVFDSDTRELRVVRRCDALVECVLSDFVTCAEAITETATSTRSRASCVYDLRDVGATSVEGTMICSQSQSDSARSFRFRASCSALMSADVLLTGEALPCALKLRTGRLFEESGTCPPL